MTTHTSVSEDGALSNISLEAIIKAFEYMRSNLPKSSDERRVLLIVGESARAAGLVGIPLEDLMNAVLAFYESGQAARITKIPGMN